MRKQNLSLWRKGVIAFAVTVVLLGVARESSALGASGKVQKLGEGFQIDKETVIAGKKYPDALIPSSHTWEINLQGQWDFFEADIGIDDRALVGGIQIVNVYIGGSRFGMDHYKQYRLEQNKDPVHIKIPIKGKFSLRMNIGYTNSSHYLWVRWINPRLISGNPSDPKGSIDTGSGKPTPEVTGAKILRLDPEKIAELADKLKTAVAKDSVLSKSKPTLAIAAFKLIPADDLAPANAENVREDLSTALINTGAFDVVERGQLDKALEELKIGLKDTFDSETAQKLGKLVNAQAVLIGSISDRGTYTVINARLIETTTGKVKIAASVELRQ